MKSKIWTITFFILLLLSTSQSFAFDGNKKGFTVGGGVHYMPSYNWRDNIKNTEGTASGLGLEYIMGYNWSGQDLLAFNMTGLGELGKDKNDNLVYFGVDWYHDFQPNVNSIYAVVGVGITLGGIEHSGLGGGGYKLGVGVELYKKIQLGVNYYKVTNKGRFFVDYDVSVDIVTLSVTAFAF